MAEYRTAYEAAQQNTTSIALNLTEVQAGPMTREMALVSAQASALNNISISILALVDQLKAASAAGTDRLSELLVEAAKRAW